MKQDDSSKSFVSLEARVSELEKEVIRREERSAVYRRIGRLAWDFVKAVVIPGVIAVATVMLTK